MKRRAKGEGSLYWNEKRGARVGQINLENGKTKTKYGKAQKEVRDWLHAQRETLKQGIFVEEDKITLSQFLDRYMADVAQHTLRPKTIESYEYLIRMHIKPRLGELRLTQLRPEQLQQCRVSKTLRHDSD